MLRDIRRRGEPGNTGQVLAAGATAALLAATADHRGDLDRAADDQRTDPWRAPELVGGQADEIGADRGDIDRSRCLTHDLWEELSNQIHLFLSSVSLGDVCERRVLGTSGIAQREIYRAAKAS